MWTLLRNWWHNGEEDACQVFRQSWRTTVAMGAAMAAVIWLIPGLHDPAAYTTFVVVMGRGGLERRRAVILTPGSLGVRGAFGATKFVPRSDLGPVESANVGGSFLLMPRPVKGLRIRRRSGGPFYIPLDMPRPERIAGAVRAAALPASAGEPVSAPAPR